MTSQSLSGRENVNTSITHFGHQSHHCTKMDSIDRSTEAVFLPRFTLLVFQKFRSGINFCPIYTIMYLFMKLPRITHFRHKSDHCAKMDSIDRSTEAVFPPRFTLFPTQDKNQPKAGFCSALEICNKFQGVSNSLICTKNEN